jgi:hypothetical protein
MPQPFKITGTVKSTGEAVRIEGEFPDDAWSFLLDFRREADRLLDALRSCDNLNCSATLSWDQETGITAEMTDAPSDRDLDVILHRIRPFVLNNERFHVTKIIGTIQRYMRHDLIERSLRPVKDLFTGRDYQSQVRVSVGDELLNCERTLQIWLNATEYHRNEAGQHFIERLNAEFPEAMSRAIFIGMVLDKVKAVLALRTQIEALERRDGTTLKWSLASPRTGA